MQHLPVQEGHPEQLLQVAALFVNSATARLSQKRPTTRTTRYFTDVRRILQDLVLLLSPVQNVGKVICFTSNEHPFAEEYSVAVTVAKSHC